VEVRGWLNESNSPRFVCEPYGCLIPCCRCWMSVCLSMWHVCVLVVWSFAFVCSWKQSGGTPLLSMPCVVCSNLQSFVLASIMNLGWSMCVCVQITLLRWACQVSMCGYKSPCCGWVPCVVQESFVSSCVLFVCGLGEHRDARVPFCFSRWVPQCKSPPSFFWVSLLINPEFCCFDRLVDLVLFDLLLFFCANRCVLA